MIFFRLPLLLLCVATLLRALSAPTNKSSARNRVLLSRKGGGGRGRGTSSGSGSSSVHGSGSKPGGKGPSFGLPSSGKLTPHAAAYSSGGGKTFTLASNTAFPGRSAGGGNRDQVYGTSRIGGSYQSGPLIYLCGPVGCYVNDRPLPFIFWPVSPAPGYYGTDQYTNATGRPGGNLTQALLIPPEVANNSNVTYRIVGDNSSVIAVLAALENNCSISNTSIITSYTPSKNISAPQPEQILQWYRGSTFFLSTDMYNNSAASLNNMPSSNTTSPLPLSQDAPLPSGINATLLQCLNETIGASVPLSSDGYRCSTHVFLFFVVGLLFGWTLL